MTADPLRPQNPPVHPSLECEQSRRAGRPLGRPWRLAGIAGALVALTGGFVLLGWALGDDRLRIVLPGQVTMKANTAAAFVLSGVALWLRRPGNTGRIRRRLGDACAALVALVGLATLAEYVLHRDLGLDQLLFPEPPGAVLTRFPGRMAVTTALSFAAVGTALLALGARASRRRPISDLLALAVATLALLALVGYVCGVPTLYGSISCFTPIAVPTALAFLILSLGILAAGPESGIVAVLTCDSPAGTIIRGLLPAGIGIPILFGALALEGQRAGLYGPEFATSLQVVATILILAVLIGVNGRSLLRAEARRRLAETAREESEGRLQAIVDNAPAVIWMKDLDGRFLLVNRGFEDLLGRRRDEMVGRTDLDLFPRETAETFRANDRAIVRGRAAAEFEEVAPGRDGLPHTYISSKFPLLDAAGRPNATCGIATDITRRKQAEEALENSERKLRLIAENTTDAIFAYDMERRLTYVNPAVERLTGHSAEEIGRRGCLSWVHPDDRARAEERWERLYAGEGYSDAELRIVTGSGEVKWCSSSWSPLLDEAGQQIGVQGRERDITDRKLAEEAHRRLVAILESTSDFVAVADVYARILHVNRAGRKLLGMGESDDVSTTRLHDYFPDWSRGLIEAEGLPAAIRDGVWTGETALLALDGREIPVSQVIIAHKTAGGAVEFVSTIARDMSERRRIEELRAAQEAALRASRLKSEFLANMSHEIRTPMNGVIGMTGLLLDTDLTPEQRDYAETVRASAHALLKIINEILDLSRIESGRLAIEPAPFDPRLAVAEVVGILAPEAEAKGIELAVAIAPEVPGLVIGDAGRVRQVLTNLVGNAIKFTPGGRVVVAASCVVEAGDRAILRVAVEDTGIGIEEEKLGSIFDKFTQADGSTTRRYGGAGLGLAISKQLLDLMGGEIGVSSRLGEGSTFWFTVPVGLPGLGTGATAATATATPAAIRIPWTHRDPAGPEPGPPDQGHEPALAPARAGARVLVVEDNAINQRVAVRMLERLGCRVDVAGNGKEALQMVEAVAYDLVFMDCWMPEMDGYEATAALRRRTHGARRIPIIAMTAEAMQGDRERCLAAGMDDYIAKPVRVEDLEAVVGRWLAAPHLRGSGSPPASPRRRAPATRPGSPGDREPG